jgi:hypothetical protein
MKKTNILRWTLGFSAVAALALLAASAWAKPNTNVTIESDGKDTLTDAEREKRQRFGIPIDGDTIAGFNEDGDPAVFRRF